MRSTEETDESLAVLAQEGDRDAFGVLVERYETRLLRYARRFLFVKEDAEDLVQDAFLSAYENIRSFRSSERFSPWMYRIAHNRFVNELRKRGHRPLLSFDLDILFPHAIAEETADGDAIREEEARNLEKVLDQLDPKYREPLVLFFYEQLSYREIADVLGIPISTVGVRVSRGKTLARSLFEHIGSPHGNT